MNTEQLETRLSAVQTELDREREVHSDLERSLAEAYETGDGDPNEIIERKAASETRIRAMEEAVLNLSAKLDEAKAADLKRRAEARMVEIARSLNGNTGEQPRRIERLREAADTFAAQAQKVSGAFERQQALMNEVQALRARFPELPMIDSQLVDPPANDEGVAQIKRLVRGVEFTYSRRRGRAPGAPPGSPGAEILAEAGPSEAEIQQRREAEERKTREREQEDRERAELYRFGVAQPGSRF